MSDSLEHRLMDHFDGATNPVEEFGPERRPDFFCIGTEKAGTTWLWNCMMSHPGIGVPQTKELRYFNEDRQFDYAHFRALKHFLENPRGAPLRPAFLERIATEMRLIYGGRSAYFRILGQLDQPIVGEITPQYCIQPPACVRAMNAAAPDARILYMLRDPVSRILSGARMSLRQSGETPTDDLVWTHATHRVQESLSNSALHIEKFETVFGADKVRTVFFEDIKTQPRALFDDVSDFLGADRVSLPDTLLAQNVNTGLGYKPGREVQLRLYERLATVYDQLSPRFPERVAAWHQKYDAL